MSALSLAFQRAMARRVRLSIEGAAIEGTPHTKTYLIFVKNACDDAAHLFCSKKYK